MRVEYVIKERLYTDAGAFQYRGYLFTEDGKGIEHSTIRGFTLTGSDPDWVASSDSKKILRRKLRRIADAFVAVGENSGEPFREVNRGVFTY